MGIIKQGILGGFKNKVGSVVGSSWKGLATMRALPLSVANPKTASQVANRTRFSACAAFASLILASLIKPLMDRFALHMSGYNKFTQVNKDVWEDPDAPTWADLVIAMGRMIAPDLSNSARTATTVVLNWSATQADRYGMPSDKVFALIVNGETGDVLFQGDTEAVRSDASKTINLTDLIESSTDLRVYCAFLRADGSEVSNTAYVDM